VVLLLICDVTTNCHKNKWNSKRVLKRVLDYRPKQITHRADHYKIHYILAIDCVLYYFQLSMYYIILISANGTLPREGKYKF